MNMRSAAILVDLQEGFIGDESPFSLKMLDELIINIDTFVTALRTAKIPIVWTRVYLDQWVGSPYSQPWPQHFSLSGPVFLARGSSSFKFAKRVIHLISDEDLIIDKPRYSAFLRTDLDNELQKIAVEHLYIAGVTTNVCVESTIRDAFQRDYFCTLVSDCTRTFSEELQKNSESVISYVFGKVEKLEDVLGRLKKIEEEQAKESTVINALTKAST